MKYEEFIKEKQIKNYHKGLFVSREELNEKLFDYQKDLTLWSLRKGKSALFCMTGTGKTYMELEFARIVHKKTNENVLILAPLAVSDQIINMARDELDIDVNEIKKGGKVDGISIINYESLHLVDVSNYNAIVLDESSILKSYSGKIRNEIIDKFKDYKYKLCATATPSPNDYMELGNHSEFLDVMSRREMLAMFFIHDGADTAKWRLKKHADETFWEWVATWSAVMNYPSDLGYDNNNFELPKLNEYLIKVKSDVKLGDGLFSDVAITLPERREARKLTLKDKVEWIKNKVNEIDDTCLIWCDLNKESEEIKKALNCVEIKGSDKEEYKKTNMLDFSKGKIKVMVTKPKIAGFGMNWQVCNNVFFCGLSDSFEQYFQAVRRCWRFGQTKPVNVYIVTSDIENKSLENIKRKEKDTENMYIQMKNKVKEYLQKDLQEQEIQTNKYFANLEMKLPNWIKEK